MKASLDENIMRATLPYRLTMSDDFTANGVRRRHQTVRS